MRRRGFTLIELSIVLVIIGLLAGAVLAGQDLIHAAEVRAQITQIEKYNSAVNTFREKFGGIPGDLQLTLAYQFGFNTSGCNVRGEMRNGDELIESADSNPWFVGEPVLFWEDLSTASLIEGKYPNSGANVLGCVGPMPALTLTPGTAYIGDYMPLGKIIHGTFVYVYETSGVNWFGLSAITSVDVNNRILSQPGITVTQAYRIDSKIDDGLPQSGNVQAMYLNNGGFSNAPNNATAGGDSTTCYDTTTGTYSVTVNSGNGTNCALSFKMQGAGP